MTEGARALLYARISEDDAQLGAGVTRQLEDGRAFCEAQGWTVVGEHVDNDLSALTGKHRPGYFDLMAAAEAREADWIVPWQTSRLWRNRQERAAGIERLRRVAVGVAPVKGPRLDLTTAYGRGLAGLLGEFDTMESEVKSERIERAARQRAQQGHANGAVAYGWTREHQFDDRGRRIGFRDVIDPQAADVVREIVRRVLRMESLASITRDLNTRGVPPPGAGLVFTDKARAKSNQDGARWGQTSVKKLVLRPANAGLRIHHRGRPDETVYDAAAPALIDRSDWEQAVAILSAPARSVKNPGGRRHLLTWGVGECGPCGSHLRVIAMHGGRHVLYTCADRGCVGRNEAAVDDFVSRVAIERLSRPDAMAWIRAASPDDTAAARAEADELRSRIQAAADAYAAGRIGIDALERVEEQLRPRLTTAERRLAGSIRAVPHDVLAELAGPTARAAWDQAPVTTRRAVLELLRVRVRILPTRPGPGFDPDSVAIDWLDA